MTTISIAMATYNGARFIRRQLDSYSTQTLLPTELIVCDDGSTDATLDIVNSFTRSAPFPVLIAINPVRLGYTANFLKAAQMCRGELIAFSDQDDEWLPGKLARINEADRITDALLIAHAAEWMDESGVPKGIVYPTDRRFRKHLQKSDFPGHAIVIRKRLLEVAPHALTPDGYKEAAGGIDFGHDVVLLELATALASVHFIPDVLARWRIYSEAGHGWTKQLEAPARATVSLADRIFPADIAKRYTGGEQYYRSHSVLLSRMLADLESLDIRPKEASARIANSMNLMTAHADAMQLRAELYSASSVNQRLKLILQGVTNGRYRSGKAGGAGIHNALRDLVAALLMLPRPT